MERELASMRHGVVGFDRYTKGFLVYVYTDHKNNLHYDSVMDNRRISKKLTNWVVELQAYNISRVWIRGESNILGDAPSRAP